MIIPNAEELDLLYEIGNDFYTKLGDLVSESITKAPEHLEPYLLTMLQDQCSVYGTDYKRIKS